ncbi:MAG TPA: amidase [Planosporangium sp.]|nr:amidase [Planosporangium sp.]
MRENVTNSRPRGFFADRTVTDLARDLSADVVSSVELVERALASIAALDPQLNAFVTVDADGARQAARRADAERAAGTDRGPLHGIPVAVKDIIETAGVATQMGSAHFADHIPARDAACVRRLRDAGAVIVGKTTTHQFAYGPTGDRSASGASRNPHDPERMTGGSSGGSAAAVASGMVPLALGTDTGGSVRIPAALCGVVGFKPTYGAVPTDGVFPLAPSLDHVGVLARTAEDCRLTYQVLAATVTASDPSAVGPLRVGRVQPDTLTPVDPDIAHMMRVAFPDSDEIDLPDAAVMHEAFSVIQGSEAYAVHADRVAQSPELFDPEVLDRLRHAGQIPGWRYVRALQNRVRCQRDIAALLSRYDLLVLPTVPVVAPPIGERTLHIGGSAVPVRDILLALTNPWNLVGLPALSVPLGAVDGLPVGVQLICAEGREDMLFTVADRLLTTNRFIQRERADG